MLHNTVQPSRKHDGNEAMPLTSCDDTSMKPSEEQRDIIRRLRASLATRSFTADQIVHGDVSPDDEGTAAMSPTGGSMMEKQLDVRIWEVIQQEIMDCHEPSQLHGLRGYSNVGP